MLKAENHTYIGNTNNLEKRLECHNSGKGAKATRKFKNWKFHTVIKGFDRSTANSFEWYWKHTITPSGWKRTPSGIDNKIKRLNELKNSEIWKNIEIEKFN